MKTFTAKDGELRLYDGSATPVYLKVLFVNADYTGPLGRNRPEENLVLDRLKFDSNTHFVQGSDAAIAEPLPMSFSFRAFDQTAGTELINWITLHKRASLTDGTEQGTYDLTTTKGTTTLKDFDGTAHTTNDFTDTSKVCFNVELRYTPAAGGASYRVRLAEVLFNQGDQTVNEGEDSVTVNLSGMVYGSVDFASADFTVGANIASFW